MEVGDVDLFAQQHVGGHPEALRGERDVERAAVCRGGARARRRRRWPSGRCHDQDLALAAIRPLGQIVDLHLDALDLGDVAIADQADAQEQGRQHRQAYRPVPRTLPDAGCRFLTTLVALQRTQPSSESVKTDMVSGKTGATTRTLVCFHAHPDDESMLTAGTMAKVAAGGDRVVLVVATRGERGEAAGFDDLGEARLDELERSATALGVARVVVLGYGDSGSGPELPPADSFVAAPIEERTALVAAILGEEAADVLTIYDPLGGYGHPDHVHGFTTSVGRRPSSPVRPSCSRRRSAVTLALAAQVVPTLGFDLPADVVPPDLSTVYTAAADITHAIDVSAHLAAKRAAMDAHVSQTTGGTTMRTLAVFLALPEDLFAAAFGTEWFVDRACPPGSALTDVFATLEHASR